ncbi:MAG: TonB-dependent receptor plug domain-containing protein, partial [Myxococcota bacterium]
MGRVALHLGAVLLIGAAPARAVANDDGIENIEVRGWSSRAAALAPKPDASLSLDARALRVEMLGDVVGEMPGVSLVRQGGLGASQFISIRGADFDQTVVLFDDVPLTGPDRGAVDFSLIPLDGFDRIELFRGSAPIRYGMGAIGGVVRLVPKEAQRDAATVSGSTGSFDTRQVRGVVEAGQGDWSFVSAGSGLWSQNNFSYLDDNATFADPTDDRKVERINADLAQGSGFAAARWERDAHRWALVGMVVHQGRGLPGPATVVSPDSRQTRTRVLTSLGYRYRGRPPRRTDAFATVAVGFDEARVRDLFGRV